MLTCVHTLQINAYGFPQKTFPQVLFRHLHSIILGVNKVLVSFLIPFSPLSYIADGDIA